MFDIRPVVAPYPGLRPFEPHESEIFSGAKATPTACSKSCSASDSWR